MSSRRRSAPAASACSARCSRPIPISAASSPGASSPARSSTNAPVKVLDRDGNLVETGRVSQDPRLPRHRARADRRGGRRRHRRHRRPAEVQRRRHAVRPEEVEPLQAQPIDPPTLSMTFSVNDSPLAGTEGDKVTSRVIRDRLFKEAEGNVALKVEAAPNSDAYVVSGRGELQLAILIETMRREGFELGVSRPKVLFRKRRRRRDAGADRGSRDRRRRGAFRRRRAEDERAQGRDGRDAPVRRRPSAARLPRADARPDRLSRRIADRHPRHRDHEPPLPQLGRLEGRDRRAGATAC